MKTPKVLLSKWYLWRFSWGCSLHARSSPRSLGDWPLPCFAQLLAMIVNWMQPIRGPYSGPEYRGLLHVVMDFWGLLLVPFLSYWKTWLPSNFLEQIVDTFFLSDHYRMLSIPTLDMLRSYAILLSWIWGLVSLNWNNLQLRSSSPCCLRLELLLLSYSVSYLLKCLIMSGSFGIFSLTLSII